MLRSVVVLLLLAALVLGVVCGGRLNAAPGDVLGTSLAGRVACKEIGSSVTGWSTDEPYLVAGRVWCVVSSDGSSLWRQGSGSTLVPAGDGLSLNGTLTLDSVEPGAVSFGVGWFTSGSDPFLVRVRQRLVLRS